MHTVFLFALLHLTIYLGDSSTSHRENFTNCYGCIEFHKMVIYFRTSLLSMSVWVVSNVLLSPTKLQHITVLLRG